MAAGIIGALAGVAALLLAITLVRPAALVPWALSVLAIAAAVTVVAVVPAAARRATAFAVTTVLALAAFAVWMEPDALTKTVVKVEVSSTPTPVVVLTTSPEPDLPAVTVIFPQPGQVLPFCFLIRFTAVAPPGYTFAAANSDPRPDIASTRFYIEGLVSLGQDKVWTGEMSLGERVGGENSNYGIEIIMLPEEWRTYLMSSRDEDGATWWTGIGLPPESKVVWSQDVHRGPDQKDC